MPERDGYIPGVPCWVDASERDPEAAVDFYSGLFGWEFEDVMPPSAEGKYFIAWCEATGSSIFDMSGDRHGGDVAAVRSIRDAAPPTAMWNIYFWVDSANEAASKVRDAGGGVVMEPFDFMNACRMAVFTIPTERRSASGRRRSTRAREWSTTRAHWSSTASTPVTWKGRGRSTDQCSGGRRSPWTAGLRCGRCPATATTSSATTQTSTSRWRRQARQRGSRTSSRASIQSRTTSPTRRHIGA